MLTISLKLTSELSVSMPRDMLAQGLSIPGILCGASTTKKCHSLDATSAWYLGSHSRTARFAKPCEVVQLQQDQLSDKNYFRLYSIGGQTNATWG